MQTGAVSGRKRSVYLISGVIASPLGGGECVLVLPLVALHQSREVSRNAFRILQGVGSP